MLSGQDQFVSIYDEATPGPGAHCALENLIAKKHSISKMKNGPAFPIFTRSDM